MKTEVQVNISKWRRAFSTFLKEKNIIPTSYHTGNAYPTDEWEHDEWYKDQLLFDEACGLKRNWYNDFITGDLAGYIILDTKKFLLAKIKYGI